MVENKHSELEALLKDFDHKGFMNVTGAGESSIPCPECKKIFDVNYKFHREFDETIFYTHLYYCLDCGTYQIGKEF